MPINNEYLYATYWSLQSEFDYWIAECGELSDESIANHDKTYEELEVMYLKWHQFFSRPFNDVITGLKNAQAEADRTITRYRWINTKWAELFDEGVWEGDEDLVKKENARLARLREDFIKKFGHAPEDD